MKRKRNTVLASSIPQPAVILTTRLFAIYTVKYSFSEPPWMHHYTMEDSSEPLPILHCLERALFIQKQSARQKRHV